MANKVVVEKDSKQALQLLSTPAFDPSREVVLDSEILIPLARQLNGTAKIVRYENKLVTIATSADNEAVLVLADSYYPGWKAFVDGKEEVVRRANLFFRAVPLPAGNHTVEFRYEPRSFMVGLVISAATLFTLAVITTLCTLGSPKKESASFTSEPLVCLIRFLWRCPSDIAIAQNVLKTYALSRRPVYPPTEALRPVNSSRKFA